MARVRCCGAMTGRALAAGLAALACSAAVAQEHEHEEPAVCAPDVLAIEGLAGWEHRAPMSATPGEYDLAVAQLVVGQAVDATLKPIDKVEFVVEPERWPEPETHAGMFAFEAPVAGIYRVAISAGAWIDIVRNERGDDNDGLVPSGAFGHGPACGGIRKMVEFTLQPGSHVLQISASPDETLAVLIAYNSGGQEP